jgi:FkbM family methyltransferase
MKKILYLLASHLLFQKGVSRYISGFKINLPLRYFRYFEPDYELNNINFINNYVSSGMTAIDVGAHIGLLTTVIANKVGSSGRVYSFEPTASTHSILNQTISLNGIVGPVTAILAAVSKQSGKTFFYVSSIDAHNSNSLSNNNRSSVDERKVEVDLIGLDEFKVENRLSMINFIKIDAEGAELSVLQGASDILKVDRPKIILALHPTSIINFGDTLEEIWDFATQKGYTIFLNHEVMNKGSFCRKTDLFDVFLLPD